MKAYCYGKEITDVIEYKEDLVIFRAEDGLKYVARLEDVEVSYEA